VFRGEFRHAIDDKGRLAVPARFRAELAGSLIVARWMDSCLGIFPLAIWEEIEAKVDALPMTDPNARLLQRQLFGGAFEDALDKQGRILVQPSLREYAGLSSEATVRGSRRYVEVWEPGRWELYSRDLRDPDAFSKAIAGLGI
jgi:MraZ protein